jgi:hypothetical protein
MSDKQEMMINNAVMASLEIPPQHLPGMANGNM